jgi:heparan-alpha-glucosaminide N-acetyltransferase
MNQPAVAIPIPDVRTSAANRVTAIDLVRALTMILMIFVNDLWSLTGVPAWLEHAERGVDGIGLADVVFPAFLFIVGLSMPFAIEARRKKGDSTGQLLVHVGVRSVALLVMGVFLVNGENINGEATGLPRLLWNTLSCLSFILIWNMYPKDLNKILVYGLKAVGIITLLTLAIVYRGGEDGGLHRFGPQWWGILGLIGWAYFASGIVTVLAGGNFMVILGAWVFFSLLSMVSHAGLLPSFFNFIPDPIRGGTLTGLTLGGVVTALIFRHFRAQKNDRALTWVLLAIAAGLIVLSIATRPYWGLAKLGATPAWLFLCSAFTILAFLAIYWVADVLGKAAWFSFIKPAGTDTLLCYLIPYFAYATTHVLGVHLPEFMLVGGVGLLKSFLFALLCVYVTGWLSKIGIRLKL